MNFTKWYPIGKDHRLVPGVKSYLLFTCGGDWFQEFESSFSKHLFRSCCASDTGLGREKQIKSWSPPKGNSGDDRFFRCPLSAKRASLEKGSNSDWSRLAGGGEGVLRKRMPELQWGKREEGGRLSFLVKNNSSICEGRKARATLWHSKNCKCSVLLGRREPTGQKPGHRGSTGTTLDLVQLQSYL